MAEDPAPSRRYSASSSVSLNGWLQQLASTAVLRPVMRTETPCPTRSKVSEEYARDSTVHGLKKLVLARSKRTRAFWFAVLAACFGFTVYGVARLVISYDSIPTITQISHVQSKEMPYPLVRFCPRSWINETRSVQQLSISYDALFFSLSMLGDVQLRNAGQLVTNVTEAELELRQWMERENITDFLEVYQRLADDANLTMVCDQCEIWPPIQSITSQGICYDLWYHSATPAKHPYSGYLAYNFTYTPPNGSWSEYFVSLYETTYTTDLMYVGESETDFFGFDPICLNANASYDILISPSFYKRISKPGMKHRGYTCLSDYEVKHKKRKTEKMCKAHCEETIYGNNCRGYNFLGYIAPKRKLPELPWYTSLNYTKQQAEKEKKCEKNFSDEFMDCVKTCHSPCEHWIFETYLKQTTDNALATGGIHVEFSYAFRLGKGVPMIEEISTRSAHTVLSDVGGQIGLWTGASALTVCQLLHFVGRWLWTPLDNGQRAAGGGRM